jgi:beta-glucanase (GH16 family)
MLSFAAPIRPAAAAATLAIAMTLGAVSASASTDNNREANIHHLREAHERGDTRAIHRHQASKHHDKKHGSGNKKKYTAPATQALRPTATTATVSATAQPDGVSGNWRLVLDSEFDGSSLDTNIWRAGWWGTGITDPVNTLEDDCYSSNNVALSGTALELSVTHHASTCKGHTYPYTGSLIDSDPTDGRASGGFEYTYGVLEARVYIPAAASGAIANWPAVWAVTTPSETYGEDDLLEGLAGQACYHYHDSAEAPGLCDVSLKPGWHTFDSDWRPGSITYYYDGTKVGSINSVVTTQPMYIILSNTVDSEDPGLASASTMQVQYVRVWQQQ